MDVFTRILGLIVVAAILGFIWSYSRKSKPLAIGPLKLNFRRPVKSAAGSPAIAVLARTRISTTHELHLIESLGQHILICTSPSGTAVLSTKDRTEWKEMASA